jgi:ketosteroid isomerase-like protein
MRGVVLIVILSMLKGCGMVAMPTPGKVQIDRWADIKADEKDVASLLVAFNRAEEALHAKDLNAVIALYSDQYRYHGLSKSDLRKAWEDIFAQYDNLASAHIFSAIRVTVTGKIPTAEITCTGNLWGVAKETEHRSIIDSWYFELHHLVYENGEWRIIGHAGGDMKALPFGTSPHPFF